MESSTTETTPTTTTAPAAESNNTNNTEEVAVPVGFPISIKTCSESNGSMQLQVTGGDNVQDIKQYLFESMETCYITNYDLYVDGKKLNDFAELQDYPEIKANAVLEMLESNYDDRSIKLHVRRLRDILASADTSSSMSLYSQLTKEETGKKKKEPKIKETDPIDKGVSLLSEFFPSEKEEGKDGVNPIACVKSIALSGWNPPPASRKLHGDLLYLEITTLENKTFYVTGYTKGFYVNSSTSNQFNPTPAEKKAKYHALPHLLSAVSPMFKKAFQSVLQSAFQRHPFEMFPLPLPVHSWVNKKRKHTYDLNRAEESLLFNNDVDFRGQLREWNEEYQACKDLPKETIQDRIVRDRAIFKVNADFVDAAVKGACAIVEKTVPPINPLDPERAHMFIYNNIFFSYAFDARDVYKEYGGDKAAYVAVNNDMRGIKLLNAADVKGLYTLATCIVDYRGYRVVGQSIIPGILQREQTSNVVYGSIDNGKTIQSDPAFHQLVKDAGKILKVKPHKVVDEASNVVELAAPLESKGIIGTDSRKYILDLVRLCPRDANYTGKENILTVLRPELVIAYYEHLRQLEILKKKQEKQAQKEKEAKEKAAQNAEVPPATDNNEKTVPSEGKQEVKEEPKSEPEAKPEDQVEEENYDDLEIEFEGFNPNVLCEGYKLGDDATVIENDENLVKRISQFLIETIIPLFIEEVSWISPLPVDGATLTTALHGHGINCRYLGKIATLADKFTLLKEICISEMIARSTKHILRNVLRTTPEYKLSLAMAHILSCLVGNGRTEFKGKKGKSKEGKHWKNYTAASLWDEICEETKVRFGYELHHTRDTYKQIVRSLPLLRSVCQKVGLQLETKNYEFSEEIPVHDYDILGLFPVVKHTEPQSSDGRNLLEAGKGYLTQGRLDIAFELLTEALAIFHQVYGPIHRDTANCYSNLSTVLYHAKDLAQALDHQQKATIINERALGLDHFETAHSYINLGLIMHALGKSKQGLTYLLHALYIIRLVSGGRHPDTASCYINIASLYQDIQLASVAIEYYKKALDSFESIFGPNTLQSAAIYHAIALAYGQMNQFKDALNYEKKNYTILHEKVGDDDLRTVESNICLKQFTAKAVQMQIETKKTQRDITNQLSQVKLDKLRSASGASSISIPQPGKSMASQPHMGTRPLNEVLSFINGKSQPKSFKERNSAFPATAAAPAAEGEKKKKKKKAATSKDSKSEN